MHTVPPPAPATDDLETSRLVLRDGSTASVRVAAPADREALGRFFHDLSPESRYKRFLTAGDPPQDLLDRFCDPDPSHALTFLALRHLDTGVQIVAAASYLVARNGTAEVAFAVDDRFHGKGLGTLLLERLAAHASANGLHRFYATTQADNSAMLDVFRESGFEVRSKYVGGLVDVQLSLTPSPEGVVAGERRRSEATVESLRPMLSPRAVAVIGASRDEAKIGTRILRAAAAAGFEGPLYAVHPSAPNILGVPTYRSARDLPAGVDLAVVSVPQAAVADVVDDCAAAGVKALVVITAGFAETGADGRAAERALVEKVRGHGMRMVGPNCMGLINMDPAVRLNASFSPVVPPGGRVAFSSQSGALGIAILALAAERQIGLSAFVSVGNKADVSSNDLLEYWEADDATRVILLYLESFGNPRRFARVARRVARTKPIVAIKAGRTRAGSRAAGSHTAALAASDVAVDALFRQSGVIRADTVDELFDIAACLDEQPLPRGGRVALVTNAGGPGILAADACEAAGLTVAELSPDTRARLAAFLPAAASLGNPVDMIASATLEHYAGAIESVLADPGVDALVVIYTPVDATKTPSVVDGIQQGIAAARASGIGRDKPVLACVMAEPLRSAPLRAAGESIPSYRFPENAVRALGKIVTYAKWRAKPAGLYWGFDDVHVDEGVAVCRKALAERGDGWLRADEAARLLHAFDLPLAPSALAHSADEAAAQAQALGFPVVAKVASTRLLHKTDLGCVRLNLSSADEVRQAFTEIDTRARRAASADDIQGVLIQPMVTGGVETIIGVANDPIFGPLIGFGIGGIDVELLGDVRFRVAPLTDTDADELLHDIRGFRLLEGYRGRPAADLEALRDTLQRVSRLAEAVPEVVELDLNPVIALSPGHGCRVVDARIRVCAPQHRGQDSPARGGTA